MKYRHFVKVKLDDRYAGEVERKNYFGFMTRFDATGIGSDRDGTSHLAFDSDRKMNKKQISKELGGLAVLALEVSEMRAA
jgi:hypothetical protein